MEKWSLEQVPLQKGRVAIITGANSGIGYETALALAMKDATVILACRNVSKAEEAKRKILDNYRQAQVIVMGLDLAILAQIKAFFKQFQSQFNRLDLLINNAGIMMSPHQVTEDGFENQFATNYLGHFALTGHLLPMLTSTPSARVVSLSSLSYGWAEIDFDDLQAEKGYSKRKAYGQSKRACLMFAYELQRRLGAAGFNTLSVAAHPGLAKTNLDRYFPALIRPLGALFLQSQKKGALPVLYAALHGSIKGGEFIGPDGFKQMRGYPVRVDSDLSSKSKQIATRLWKVSQELTHVSYLEDKSYQSGSSIIT